MAVGVCLFLFGLWPRSAVASPLFAWRNANLAGGFAGRPGFVWVCLVFRFSLPQIVTVQLEPLRSI